MSGDAPLLERLSRAAGTVTGDDERAATFARGLILGALVGAAIAGSTIWQRRHARSQPPAGDSSSGKSQAPDSERRG